MIASNVKLSEKDKAIFEMIIEDLQKEGEVTMENVKKHSLFSRLEQKDIFSKMIPISVSIEQISNNSFGLYISGTGIDLANILHKSYITDKINKFIMDLAGFVEYLNKENKNPLLKMILAEINSSCKKN